MDALTIGERLARILGDRARPYVMAHRGNRVACPENTLAAFRQALADGADLLETDLHLAADGTLVCIHDATVDRTTDGQGAVADMTLAQIKRLSAAGGRAAFAAERVPALAEVAALLPGDVGLALELKTDRFLEPEVGRRLAAELEEAGVRERCLVLSFSLARVRAVQSVARDLPGGWITLSRAWPLAGVQVLGPLWPLLVVNPFYTWLAHRQGQFVCPLDPTPDARLGWYLRLGCDAILSDDPAATVRALRSRLSSGDSSRPEAMDGGAKDRR